MTYSERYSAMLDAAVDVPTLPAPIAMTYAQREKIAQASELVYAALETLARIAYTTSELDDVLDVDEAQLRLMRSRSPIAHMQVFTRFDIMGDPSGDFGFIEANTSDPSGLGYIDAMTRAHASAGGRHRFDDLAASHIRCVTSLARFDRGCFALVTDRDSPIRNDLVCLANRYRAHGIDARVADARELRVDGSEARLGDTVVAALHRDLIDEYSRPPFWPAVADLVGLLGRGKLPVINPFAASLVDSKSFFEILSSERAVRYFDIATTARLRTLIPWTRRLGEDIRKQVLRDRDQLVVKPARAYGGAGVVVGTACAEAEWSAAVDNAIADGHHVVQRRVAPIKSNGFDVVYGAWVHRGSYAGAFARVGHGAVLNVHRGGGLVPIALVSEFAEARVSHQNFEESSYGDHL